MEDTTNGQDNDDEIIEEDHYNEENVVGFNEDIFEMLKQDDPAITHVDIHLNCNDGYFFNSVDWKVDGDCIANNTHLKKIVLSYRWRPDDQPYVLGKQGQRKPTRQQLQDFFSCIYRNRSIKQLHIRLVGIDDDFSGGLIEGLCGHHSLERLQIGSIYDEIHQANVGSIGCSSIGKVLVHPQSKLKDLRLPYCQLDDDRLGVLCDALLGNSRMKSLSLSCNRKITSVGWKALSTVLQHPNLNWLAWDYIILE